MSGKVGTRNEYVNLRQNSMIMSIVGNNNAIPTERMHQKPWCTLVDNDE